MKGVESGKETGEEEVWAVLKTCYDPEIPVNIVDLGLIYSMELKNTDGGGKRADVKMTLTAQGCGMGPSIAADARQKILSLWSPRGAGGCSVGSALGAPDDHSGWSQEVGDGLVGCLSSPRLI